MLKHPVSADGGALPVYRTANLNPIYIPPPAPRRQPLRRITARLCLGLAQALTAAAAKVERPTPITLPEVYDTPELRELSRFVEQLKARNRTASLRSECPSAPDHRQALPELGPGANRRRYKNRGEADDLEDEPSNRLYQ